MELPGAEDLQAALAFFEGCSFLAVPGQPQLLHYSVWFHQSVCNAGSRSPACAQWLVLLLVPLLQLPLLLPPASQPVGLHLVCPPLATCASAHLRAPCTQGPFVPVQRAICAPADLGMLSSVPRRTEEERASTAKWAVLQALLARGLHHLGGCSFRQLAVPLTHVGDELLKVGRPLVLCAVGWRHMGAWGTCCIGRTAVLMGHLAGFGRLFVVCARATCWIWDWGLTAGRRHPACMHSLPTVPAFFLPVAAPRQQPCSGS